MSQRGYKRKWSNYLLNSDVQRSYIVTFMAIAVVICTGLGILIYQQEASAISSIQDLMSDPSFSGVDKAFVSEDLSDGRTNLVLQMILIGFLLVVVMFLYLVVMTHKVAGPLHKISGYFENIKAERLGVVWPLRKGDLMVSFYESFQKSYKIVRQRHMQTHSVVGAFLEVAQPEEDGSESPTLASARAHHDKRTGDLAD